MWSQLPAPVLGLEGSTKPCTLTDAEHTATVTDNYNLRTVSTAVLNRCTQYIDLLPTVTEKYDLRRSE